MSRSGALPSTHLYRAQGLADETAQLQAFLSSLTAGQDALILGTPNVSTLTVAARVSLRFAPGAGLAKIGSTSDSYVSGGASGPSFTDVLRLTAAGILVEGGTITCPAVWDGTNDGSVGVGACAVVRVSANQVEVAGVTLVNVPKYGITVTGDDVKIVDNWLYGNFPVASYTGTNTGHCIMQLDPPNSTAGGASVVEGNKIAGGVQGISLANYGAGVGYGYNITGNTFQGCHNHGVYQQSGVGNVISDNDFYECQTPVVTSGQGQVVRGNTIFASSTGDNDAVTGISGRDLTDSVIAGNTIVGDSTATNVGIAVDSVNGTTLRGVIVEGNVLDLAGPGGKPGIRVGTSTTQVMQSIKVLDNVVRGPGQPSRGLIDVSMAAGYYGYGNRIEGNQVTVTGNSHGIYVANQRAGRFAPNTCRNEYNAAAATTIVHTYLSNVSGSVVRDLSSINPSGFGTNCTLRGLQADAGCSGNKLGPVATYYEAGLTGSVALLDQGAGNLATVDVGTASAAPTTGTWAVGQYLLNSAPAVGSPKGWVCTVAGTPGTWASLGNL